MGEVIILSGAPCSGKSTLARELAGPGGLVLDRDDLARRLGSPARWLHPYRYSVKAEQWMQRELRRLAWGYDGRAIVIRCLARAADREALADQLHATVRVLDPGEDECVRRAVAGRRPHGTIEGIHRWYDDYRAYG